jgi:hypothetical protein
MSHLFLKSQRFLLLTVFYISIYSFAQAQTHHLAPYRAGFGGRLGPVPAFNAKCYVGKIVALEGILGTHLYSIGGAKAPVVTGNFCFSFFVNWNVPLAARSNWRAVFGVGGDAGRFRNTRTYEGRARGQDFYYTPIIGVTGLVGIEYHSKHFALQLDWKPVLRVVSPHQHWADDIGLTLRYTIPQKNRA